MTFDDGVQFSQGSQGDQGLGGPSHGEFQGFQFNLPRNYEREEQVRHASLENKSGNREINVFLKSSEGHTGVNQGEQQRQHEDHVAQESISFQQEVQPSIGGRRFNDNNKDERIRTDDN